MKLALYGISASGQLRLWIPYEKSKQKLLKTPTIVVIIATKTMIITKCTKNRRINKKLVTCMTL